MCANQIVSHAAVISGCHAGPILAAWETYQKDVETILSTERSQYRET